MSDNILHRKRRRIRKRQITPSNPPATSFHPVYTFEPCAADGCVQLHVPAATGSKLCPECLEKCDIPNCWACEQEGGQ